MISLSPYRHTDNTNIMKTCTKCKQEKPIKDFYKQSGRKNGSSYCKNCFNDYCIERWIQRKLDAIEYKGGKCVNCGYDKHYAALQFHHTDPLTKEVIWTKLRLRSWKKIKNELDKCVLLCSNCHAIEHSGAGSVKYSASA